MASRITVTVLRAQIERLNEIANTPPEPYVWSEKQGKKLPQAHCYHLSQAYGGYSLHKMAEKGTGITDVFSCGHTTARELSQMIDAYIRGIADH